MASQEATVALQGFVSTMVALRNKRRRAIQTATVGMLVVAADGSGPPTHLGGRSVPSVSSFLGYCSSKFPDTHARPEYLQSRTGGIRAKFITAVKAFRMNDVEWQAPAWDGLLVTLMVLFAVSLSLNVWLGVSLRAENASLKSYAEHATPIKLAGAVIGGKPALSKLRDVNGDATSLSPAKNLILYYFSPSCIWCKRNLESVKRLAATVGPKYEVVGLVSNEDGLKNYLAIHTLPFRVIVDGDLDDASALGLRGTPQTVLLTNGVVTQNWVGAYMGSVKNSVEAYFKTTLPNVTQ